MDWRLTMRKGELSQGQFILQLASGLGRPQLQLMRNSSLLQLLGNPRTVSYSTAAMNLFIFNQCYPSLSLSLSLTRSISFFCCLSAFRPRLLRVQHEGNFVASFCHFWRGERRRARAAGIFMSCSVHWLETRPGRAGPGRADWRKSMLTHLAVARTELEMWLETKSACGARESHEINFAASH